MGKHDKGHRSSKKSSRRADDEYDDEAGPSRAAEPQHFRVRSQYGSQASRSASGQGSSSAYPDESYADRDTGKKAEDTRACQDVYGRAGPADEDSGLDGSWEDLAVVPSAIEERATKRRPSPTQRPRGNIDPQRFEKQEVSAADPYTIDFQILSRDDVWEQAQGLYDSGNEADNLICLAKVLSLGFDSTYVDFSSALYFPHWARDGGFYSYGTIELYHKSPQVRASRMDTFHVVDRADGAKYDAIFVCSYADPGLPRARGQVAMTLKPKEKPSKRVIEEQKRRFLQQEQEAYEEEQRRLERKQRERERERERESKKRNEDDRSLLRGARVDGADAGASSARHPRPFQDQDYPANRSPYPGPPEALSKYSSSRATPQDYYSRPSSMYSSEQEPYTGRSSISSRPEPSTRQTSQSSLPKEVYPPRGSSYALQADPYGNPGVYAAPSREQQDPRYPPQAAVYGQSPRGYQAPAMQDPYSDPYYAYQPKNRRGG